MAVTGPWPHTFNKEPSVMIDSEFTIGMNPPCGQSYQLHKESQTQRFPSCLKFVTYAQAHTKQSLPQQSFNDNIWTSITSYKNVKLVAINHRNILLSRAESQDQQITCLKPQRWLNWDTTTVFAEHNVTTSWRIKPTHIWASQQRKVYKI